MTVGNISMKCGEYTISYINIDGNHIQFMVWDSNDTLGGVKLIWDLSFNNGGWLLWRDINTRQERTELWLNSDEKTTIIEFCRKWYKTITGDK